MLKRNLLLGAIALAFAAASTAEAAAQDPSTRFGQWWLDGNSPPPSVNIMTYAPWGNGGMSITVASTNGRGEASEWGYNTMFDGEFRPVHGQEGSETAVEWVDDKTTRIINRRNGRVTQVIINTLSDDGSIIENEYIRMDADGKITGVGHATYLKIS
jgi:hypothetical protein